MSRWGRRTRAVAATAGAARIVPPQEPPTPAALMEDEVLRRLEQLERRLSDVQALVARTYEAGFAWPTMLDAGRSEDDYEAAYGPEPLVSVRVATYNAAELLCERAIASLRRQTYTRWEATVVGDACTDETETRIQAIGDKRIRFVNRPFRGTYPDDDRARWYVAGIPPMNDGIAQARGAWIAPLDHDDEWDDDHLEVLLGEAKRSHAELVYGRIRIIDAATGERTVMGRWPPERGQFGFLGAMHHRALRRFLYDANCRFADEPGDWNLARRLWDAGVRFSFVDREVATYHFVPRHVQLTTEQRMIEELRRWATQLQEGRDFWRSHVEKLEAELARRDKARPS